MAIGSNMRILISLCVVLVMFVRTIAAWDSAELEVFDVVEDVNQNFYEFLGVTKAGSSTDIKKAYRRLSLQLHPDKNKEDDAEEKFRKLVAIYEILKDEEKRKIYDDVLQNGLPTWRQPVYYYRRVRKMSLLELSLFLFVLLTGGQYILAWSMYIEKKFELVHPIETSFGTLYRFQGVALPMQLPLNHFAYSVLIKRASQLNVHNFPRPPRQPSVKVSNSDV